MAVAVGHQQYKTVRWGGMVTLTAVLVLTALCIVLGALLINAVA